MGKIGRVVDAVAIGFAAYLVAFGYFFWATGRFWAGALMAVLPGALAALACRRAGARLFARREQARRAQAAVEALSLLAPEEAREQAAEYAGFTGVLLQRHPKGAPLEINEILELWQGAQGDVLEIATTGPISDEAYALSEALSGPKLRLYDGGALAGKYANSGLALKAPPAAKRRLTLSVPRKRAKHCALYGVAMLGMYVVTGLFAYLAGALILLALTFLALRRPAASRGRAE